VTGADVNSLLAPDLTLDERIKKLREFIQKPEKWLTEYAAAYESAESGDDCKKYEAVSFFGEKAIEVVPFFWRQPR
jgi:predicted metal-dependent hydrolase